MLRGIDPLLSPELLRILRAMGHGDEITIVDANYPALSNAKRLVRLDGANATQALEAILSVLPLDSFVDNPAHCMQVVGKPDEIVGSSRVDLQACKLEYSIVSPK